jgi:hypothetical protein
LAAQTGIRVLPMAYQDVDYTLFTSTQSYYTAAVSAGINHFGFGLLVNRVATNLPPVHTIFRSFDLPTVKQTSMYMGAAFDVGGFLFPGSGFLASVGTTAKYIDLNSETNGWDLDVGTLLGYRFNPNGLAVQPMIGVNARNVTDGYRGPATTATLQQDVQIGASVEIVPSWQQPTGAALRFLATFQTDTFYGDDKRKPLLRSGLEMTALELISGRLGQRYDTQFNERFTDFGFGVGYKRLHLGSQPLALQLDFASLENFGTRSEVYSLIATMGL